MMSQETAYLKSEFKDYNLSKERMNFYLFPIDAFSQFNLDTLYDRLRETLPLNVFSDLGRGLQRPSAEMLENVWGMPYVIARGRKARKKVKKILRTCGKELTVDFQGIRSVKADSPSRLARMLGFIQ